jgi:hypothetical protein
MAKGLRASVTKRNKAKLRSRVFGPVEAARTERLSAKLMELVQQPKPTRDTEMLQVDGQSVGEDKSTEEGEKDRAASAEGQSLALQHFALSCPVPRNLVDVPGDSTGNESASGSESESESESEREGATVEILRGEAEDAELDMFYHFLGLCSDITGFTKHGGLAMLFEH